MSNETDSTSGTPHVAHALAELAKLTDDECDEKIAAINAHLEATRKEAERNIAILQALKANL